MLSVNEKQLTWKNWSASVFARPKKFVRPNHLDELMTLVKNCRDEGVTIRLVGAGHSFTPLVATSEVLISLDNLTGIVKVNKTEQLVTLWGGTRLRDVGPLLNELGFAMENLGDINDQSIAGAISTGTHGTGSQFKSISNQVEGITLLTASGELINIDRRDNEEYFEAARLSLGMLGIIVKVTLRVVKAYSLHETSYRLSLDEGLANLQTLRENNRNFEFFWFPYTKSIQVKTLNERPLHFETTNKKQSFKKIAIENGLFWLLSEMSRTVPNTSRFVSKISALGIPSREEENLSYLQYATPRLVKFNEMEYSVPEDAMGEVLKDIEALFRRKRIDVHFPLECRYVQGDSIWLSPSYKRDSAYIAVHMYKGMAFNEYFSEVEVIFSAYEGRPHWGKMHSLQYEDLVNLYPKFPEFLQVRQTLDPEGMFLNEYVRKLFHIKK